jgi:threonine/homoserine/homoserine lactone efflux protein
MDVILFVTGIFIGLSVTAPLGPVNLIVIRTAIERSFGIAVLTGLGAVLADAVYASLAAYGVSTIERFIAQFALPLTLIGGSILVFLGIRLARSHISLEQLTLDGQPPSRLIVKNMLTTFALTMTNPGAFFGFLAIFGTMSAVLALSAAPGRPPTVVAGVVMGGTLWWLFLSFVVTRLKSRVTEATFDRINRWTGVLIAAFGFALLMDVLV